MDFTFSPEQQTVNDLASTILSDLCSPERLREIEVANDEDWPHDAWNALADAGLLGIGIPESCGGGGLGLAEVGVIVQAVARAAAPLPAFASLVLAATPIIEFGSPEQQNTWLPSIVDGSRILTGVLTGADDSTAPVCCERAGDGPRRITGQGWFVPFGAQADAFVVGVATRDGSEIIAVVERSTPGVTVESLASMSGVPAAIVRFDETPISEDNVLASSNATGLARWRDVAIAATCVAQTGTCEGALTLTANYVSNREQFGSKLATFQAVAHRAADGWIDTELVRLTAWTALWRLGEQLDASAEISVAKYFCGEAAQRVVAAAQHLHGGIGMDLDYPVHRYFRWAKDHELRLGSGSAHLASLGQELADE